MLKSKITEQIILEDYGRLKSEALKNINKKKIEKACEYISKAADLMYQSNLIYADDELEDMLHKIKTKLLPDAEKETALAAEKRKQRKNNVFFKVVFYDYFTTDNRGLTEQYIDALQKFDCKVLFINCQKDIRKSVHILETLETAENICVYNVKEDSSLGKAREIWNVIFEFQPDKLLVHTSPSDVPGLVVADMMGGFCQRFLINLTDHAFWLGKECFDYFFEFRNYGYNISRIYRKIPEKKLLHLPYYPIVNTRIPFRGFDFDMNGKTVIFSGGGMYKIQGSGVFLELVSWILNSFPNTVFLYLGSGNKKYFNKFIKNGGYEGRFFYGEERDDIYEVFRHCDLYLNTYPISGALMVQYAAVCGKIPITFAEDWVHTDSDLSELFCEEIPVQIQFGNMDEMKRVLRRYLGENKELLRKDGEKLKNAVICKKSFQRILWKYLEGQGNQLVFEEYDIDIKRFSRSYIDRFNECRRNYYRCFLSKRHLSVNFRFRKYFFLYVFKVSN